MIRAGVIGWPVAHSRSPLIHGHWLKVHGIDGAYDRIPVEPDEAAAFFAGLPESGLAGVNVTLPHKEAAAAAVTDLDPVARRLGAANTLWLEDGRLRATNTDVHGFLANLDERAPGWDRDPRLAVVVGAGGAARAVVDGLVGRGHTVVVANRTLARAEAIVAMYPGRASAIDLASLDRTAADPAVRLVVNTTAVGLHGDDGAIPLDFGRIGSESIVTDIVYVPLLTPFLAAARARGLRTVDGLGMLLHQAVPGFEHWFGVRPAVTTELRAIVEADLSS
jgi:shikimate dehydrogenase